MTPRHLLLAAALAGTAALVWFGEPAGPDGEVVGAVERPVATAARAVAARSGAPSASPADASPGTVLRLRERLPPSTRIEPPPDERQGLFASTSWEPPAKPAPPPAPPSAPEPPWHFVGKTLEGGRWEVFLSGPDDALVQVRPGLVLGGNWRVEQVRPPVLTLLYLPLQQQRTLDIGSPE